MECVLPSTPRIEVVPRADLERDFLAAIDYLAPLGALDGLARLTDTELRRLTDRLERRRHASGASVMAWAVTGAALIAAVATFSSGASSPRALLVLLALALGFVLSVTVIVRLAARTVGRLRWRRERLRVVQQLAEVGFGVLW